MMTTESPRVRPAGWEMGIVLVRVRRRTCLICGARLAPRGLPWGLMVETIGGGRHSVAFCGPCLREWAAVMDDTTGRAGADRGGS